MADQFDRMMGKFLTPLSELGPRIKDSLYFLRRDGCLIFSHGYYHPTPGYFLGKIIHYPTPEGSEDIWGRRYEAIHKAWIGGERVAILNDIQIARHYRIDPSLDPTAPRPLVADYTIEFPLADFVGFFDPLRSMKLCREMYPQIRTWTEETAELMEFPSEKIGVTGSLAFGIIEEHDMDFDVIFIGDLEENDRALKKIFERAQEPGGRVFEFGQYWSIRIYYRGFLLCPFFVYQNWEDVPLSEGSVELFQDNVEGTAKIVDDFHNPYLPIILELEEVLLNGEAYDHLRFISYDGSIRGDYRTGDRIWFKGRLVRVRGQGGEYLALVVDISYNIGKIG